MVVVDAGLVVVVLDVVVDGTGVSTNLIWSKDTATRCSPTPSRPPTPSTTALMFPLLSVSRSLIVPMLSLLSL